MCADDILVTVICTTYNHGLYVRDALEGFISQKTSFKYQVIVHDDASTDNTAEIIREYSEKYPDIICPIFQTVNQYSLGVCIREKYIAPLIRGKYIALCEGDDYWTDALKLQKQFDFMEAHPEYSLVVGSTKTLDCVTGKYDDRYVIGESRTVSMRDLILENNGRMFQTSSAFMPIYVYLDRKKWQSLFPYGDRPMWMRAALDGKIYMMKDVLSVYRYRALGSWTESISNNDCFKKEVIIKVINGMKAFDSDTDYRYHDDVEASLQKLQYDLCVLERDLNKILTVCRTQYLRESFLSRLRIRVRCKHFWLYNLFKKIHRKR